jgi:hypothetical protein
MTDSRVTREAVRITWNDSSVVNRGGWTSMDQIHPRAICTCVSIGWVIRENKEEVVIAGCETIDGPFSRIAAIPKACIVKREIIGRKDKRRKP